MASECVVCRFFTGVRGALIDKRLKLPVGSVKLAPKTTAVLPWGTLGSSEKEAEGGVPPVEGGGAELVWVATVPQAAMEKTTAMKTRRPPKNEKTRRIGISLLGEFLK